MPNPVEEWAEEVVERIVCVPDDRIKLRRMMIEGLTEYAQQQVAQEREACAIQLDKRAAYYKQFSGSQDCSASIAMVVSEEAAAIRGRT